MPRLPEKQPQQQQHSSRRRRREDADAADADAHDGPGDGDDGAGEDDDADNDDDLVGGGAQRRASALAARAAAHPRSDSPETLASMALVDADGATPRPQPARPRLSAARPGAHVASQAGAPDELLAVNDQKLSKLTLSNSLHQLSDSKFLNQTRNLHPASGASRAAAAAAAAALTDPTHPSTAMDAAPRSPPDAGAEPDAAATRAADAGTAKKTRLASIAAAKKREANMDTVHVVVGNESCDLDSAVSCLLMFHIISKMSDEINGKDNTRTLYIPLLNTTRDLLDNKAEVLWFLKRTLNIDKSFLTCKDDIDWAEIKRNGIEVLITLVDHNYNPEFKDIGRVVEIIDHHQVQNPQWLLDNQANLRLTLDTSVGSCTTLIAERLFYIYAEHHVSDEILLLIYGTVLLDTICLSEKAKRFTRRDVYLLRKLDALLGNKKPQRAELYKQLVEVKAATGELDFGRLMSRDLKTYRDKSGQTQIGIASLFGMSASHALGLAPDLDQFFRQNHYEAFIIMGLVADPQHSDSLSRDLVLLSSNPMLFEELCRALEADSGKLELLVVWSNTGPADPEDKPSAAHAGKLAQLVSSLDANNEPVFKLRIWQQRNVSSSRKVVAPLVLKVLHDTA